jgi:hypothetical protein
MRAERGTHRRRRICFARRYLKFNLGNYYLEGQPYLDTLIFRIVPEPAAQLALMMEGVRRLWRVPGGS